MSNEPVFAQLLSVAGILLLRNQQFVDASHMLVKSLIIDPGLHESRYALKKCTENLRVPPLYYEKLAYNVHSKPGNIFSWMISDSSRKDTEQNSYYDKLISQVNEWVSDNFEKMDLFNGLIDFITQKIEKVHSNDNIVPYLYSMKAHYMLAQAYLNLNNRQILQSSDKFYEKSINLISEGCRASSWRGRAEINCLLGNYENSLKYSNKSIECDPSYPYSYITKGIVLWKLGKRKEAINLFDQGINIKLNGTCTRKSPNEKLKNSIEKYILKRIENNIKNNHNQADCRREFESWVLSSYFYGYCPFDPNEIPYFSIGKRENLRICHNVEVDEESMKHLRCHSVIKL